MSTSLVVLTAQRVAAGPAIAYATRLAAAVGVPLHVLADSLGATVAPSHNGTAHHAASAPALSLAEAAQAAHQALLVVVGRPSSAEAPPGWLAALARALLQAVAPPILVVPAQAIGRVPPLTIALAADGKPFRLVRGRRALHALLFTLPVHLTVLHVRLPGHVFSAADALQSVLECGLATRCATTQVQEVVATSALAGILLGLRQAGADLLVLLVRPRSLRGGHFARGLLAALLQQSPVPVLLVATET